MLQSKCNLCGGEDFREFGRLPKIDTGRNFAASGFKANGERLVECKHCGLVFIEDPIKYPDDILNEYAMAEDDDYVSQIDLRIKTFKDSLYIIEDVTDLWAAKNKRILDIGAAAGAFVKVCLDEGWSAYGIEPCKFLVKWGKENLKLGSHLEEGTIDSVDLGKFDVITFWDVLEHTSDPNKTIKQAADLLEKNGYIVINIPDISSIIPVVMDMRWPFYESAHLYYFTGDTLDALMRMHGLERVHYEKYWQGLSLGYLAYRFKQFNETIAGVLAAIIDALGFSNVPIKYYIGQSFYVYKLVKRQNNGKK